MLNVRYITYCSVCLVPNVKVDFILVLSHQIINNKC